MTMAVAFTEYQLIQIQSLITHYGLKEAELITFKKNRIPEWLIDRDLYRDILFLPEVDIPRYKRLEKPFIDKYHQLIKKFLGNKKTALLIGAQDENTIFSLIKYLTNPDDYWSIEDGLANYYERDLSFKTGILFKRILFNIVYGYDLDIAFGHGKMHSDKSFRILPSLCADIGDHVASGPIIKSYLEQKVQEANGLLNEFSDKYYEKKELVISNISKIKNEKNLNNYCLYKLHPNDIVNENFEVDYIKDAVPVEILVAHMKNLQKVRFDSISTSIANLIYLYDDIRIEINFSYGDKKWGNFLNDLIKLHPNRFGVK